MNKLPSGYQQVEYIESTGTQYIDTNYILSNNNAVEIKVELLESNANNKMILGSRSGASSNNISINATNDIVLDFNNSSYSNYRATYNYQVNTPYVLYSSKAKRVIYSNNKEQILAINSNMCNDSIQTSHNAYVFSINPKPADTWLLAKMRLYYLKIYENDNLVRDLIPCYRKADNEIGLYDIVNDVFYTNQGTGTFLKGDNITVTDKLSYLSETKKQIKDRINFLTGELTDETPFREYTNALDNLYSELPKTSQDGTSVTLANTRRGKIEITPKGNTYQQSYEGTQLIGFDDISETTINGITYSIKDNVFTLNGTATDNVRYIYNNHWKLKSAGNYNLKIEPISGTWTAGIMGLSLRRANNTQSTYHQLAYDTTNLNATKSYTDTQIEETASIGFYINTNSVFSNYKFRIIYNEGSTAKDYEPYVGGTPSPNPDYPQDIKVVTGENDVIIRGKNLFDKNNTTIWSGFFSAAGKINGKGRDSSTNKWFYIQCKPNTTYTITKPLQTITSNNRFRLGTTHNIPQNLDLLNDFWRMDDGGVETTHSITTSSNANYLCVYYGSTENNTDHILEVLNGLQIEEGSTATTYEPYIEPIEKELNLGNIELAKIGDYSDLIFKNEITNPYYNSTLIENAWYKHTNICKHDTWDVIDSKAVYSATVRPQFLLNEPTNTTNRQYTLSNYFQNQINNNDVEHIFIGTGNPGNVYNGLNVFISKSRATTDTEVKNWLKNNNVVVYYVPANPLDVQITETALINQLEEINKVIGKGGTVIIETESEEGNAQLIVNASALASFENE